jgi:hypothetical protein
MNKRQAVVGLFLMSMMAGAALAQSTVRGTRQAQKPKFDEKLGTCNITGFSKDQVWAAVLKALRAEKIEVVRTIGDWIYGRQTTGARVEVDIAVVGHPKRDDLRPWAPAVSLGIDIPTIGELMENRTWTAAQRQALSRKLYEKITDILYRVPEK